MQAEEMDILRAKLLEKMGDHADKYTGRIERFPHIFRNIVELWGKPELDAYLHDLMVSQRVRRAGFPQEVALDILRLSSVHGALGLTKEPTGSVWQWAAEVDVARSDEDKSGG
jgi:hypothetical protein